MGRLLPSGSSSNSYRIALSNRPRTWWGRQCLRIGIQSYEQLEFMKRSIHYREKILLALFCSSMPCGDSLPTVADSETTSELTAYFKMDFNVQNIIKFQCTVFYLFLVVSRISEPILFFPTFLPLQQAKEILYKRFKWAERIHAHLAYIKSILYLQLFLGLTVTTPL